MNTNQLAKAFFQSLPPIEQLRIQAKRFKKASNGEFTHAECLDLVARMNGFNDWKEVMSLHPEEAP